MRQTNISVSLNILHSNEQKLGVIQIYRKLYKVYNNQKKKYRVILVAK